MTGTIICIFFNGVTELPIAEEYFHMHISTLFQICETLEEMLP